MATTDQRTHLQALLDLACAHPGNFGYLALRPMANIGLYERDLVTAIGRDEQLRMDCSEFAKLMFKMAGLKDPTGYNYAPYGNSNSMYETCSHFTDPLATLLGSLVVFGADGADHVAIIYDAGITDPLVVSHGDATGPHKFPLSGFASEYPEHTFLSVGVL